MADEFVKHKEDDQENQIPKKNLESKQNFQKEENLNNEIVNSTETEKLESNVNEELKELENLNKRILADYQNLQKRFSQEREELYKYASFKTIETLLPALDTFEYARASLNPENNVEKIIKDFNLVFETLLRSLKEIGVETIEETGIPFDPVYHDPIQQIPTNELPPHTVMQVLKRGYLLNKKVIRPAVVTVSTEETKKDENTNSNN